VRGSQASTYTYDGTLVTSGRRSGDVTSTLAWTYDTDFRPSSFRYAGTSQTYGYDADGLLTSAAPFSIARSAASGLPTTLTAPGLTQARTFSGYGELDSLATTIGASSAYAYSLTRDAAGRVATKTETLAGASHTSAYTYDAGGRLSAVTVGGQLAESYAYGSDGNRIALRAPARGIEETAAATLSPDGRTLTSGASTYTFDADGFLSARHTAEGTATFTYSALGELTGAALPDGRAITYTKEAIGRRVAKSVDGTVTERYLWADATHLLATYDGSGTLTARFTYADGRVPVSFARAGQTYFLTADQVGTVRAGFDASAPLVKRIDYDSFGNVTSDSNSAFALPLGFAGGLADADTGLTLFGARDYYPVLGRFAALDPIDFAGGDMDLYGYCIGDPMNFYDATGLITVSGGYGGQAGLLSLGGGLERSLAFDGRQFADYRTDASMVQVPGSGLNMRMLSRNIVAGEAGGGLSLQVTSAPSVACLKGASQRVGVTLGPLPWSVSLDFVWSDTYFGAQVSAGLGPHFPASFHYLVQDSMYLPPEDKNLNLSTAAPALQGDQFSGMRSRDY
jgi:RHS repeat-associated protein